MSAENELKARRDALTYALRLVSKDADEAMHVRRASRDVVEGIEAVEATLKAMLAATPALPEEREKRRPGVHRRGCPWFDGNSCDCGVIGGKRA
jgi:hypothetical protein